MDSRRLKKRLYIDMDGVLCDYKDSYSRNLNLYPSQPYPQSQFGFFLELKTIENSLESVKILEDFFDVWILTRPSVYNLSCYTEKAQWIRKYLGIEMQAKTIFCTDKSLLKGHFLVDDQIEHGQTQFEGFHILFGGEEFPDWNKVVTYLIENKDFIQRSNYTSDELYWGC